MDLHRNTEVNVKAPSAKELELEGRSYCHQCGSSGDPENREGISPNVWGGKLTPNSVVCLMEIMETLIGCDDPNSLRKLIEVGHKRSRKINQYYS